VATGAALGQTLISAILGTLSSSTTLTVIAGAAKTFVVSGFPSPTMAGVAGSFTVTAKDSLGNTARGYSGTIYFTSSDSQALLPGKSTLINGTGTFTATLKTAGLQSITATDSTSISGSQNAISVLPAAASGFRISAPTSVTPGATFSFTVAALDAYSNIATSCRGTIRFTSSDKRSVLPKDYTFVSTDNGSHIFSAILKTLGNQTITATDKKNNSISGTAVMIVGNTIVATNVVSSATGSTPVGFASGANSSVVLTSSNTDVEVATTMALVASNKNARGPVASEIDSFFASLVLEENKALQ
jgi:hypothetical protein